MKNLIFLLSIALVSPAVTSPTDFDMVVRPSVDIKRADVSLGFDLKYTGPKAVEVQNNSLIGVQPTAIWITVKRFLDFNSEPHQTCPEPEERIFIDDGILGVTKIQPGEIRTQNIKLSERYSNLAEIIGKCDIAVYWSYKASLEEGAATRLAGALIVPASK